MKTTMKNYVQDMYTNGDREASRQGRKAIREAKLRKHPNILFRIYKNTKKHVLLFNSDATDKWFSALEPWLSRSDLCLQVTIKYVKDRAQPVRVTTFMLEGRSEKLDEFCKNFKELRISVLNNQLQMPEKLSKVSGKLKYLLAGTIIALASNEC